MKLLKNKIEIVFIPFAILIASASNGCEAVAQIATAPLFIAEGIQESYDRKQTEKQEGHPYGINPNRSYYDAQNPQPKAFYDWMDKVGRVAAQREINIDGDEDWFIRYWKNGLNPETAVSRFATETK